MGHIGLYVGMTGMLPVAVLGKHSAKLLNASVGAALLSLADV